MNDLTPMDIVRMKRHVRDLLNRYREAREHGTRFEELMALDRWHGYSIVLGIILARYRKPTICRNHHA